MNIEELKNRIIEANKAYRSGSAIMSDLEFDSLLEEYQKTATIDEYNAFRNSLHEVKGKVKHPFIMGSLDKLKTEEPETIFKFIKENVKTKLNVSAKVDGISCRLHYENGILKSASTRGDGEFGEDITDKIKFVRHVPTTLSIKDPIDIRGELVIFKSDFMKMTGFANPRNACAGIMNRKDWSADDVKNISFVAYTILGPKYQKCQQFHLLETERFCTAWYDEYSKSTCENEDFVDKLFELANSEHEYECDGLVICDSTYYNESKYRPDACCAVKINQLTATTKLIDVAWEGPSKNGLIIPVGLIQPTDLGGSTISRVTLHNLDFIQEKNLKYGSAISIVKSGDIIPKVVALIENDNSCRDIDIPTECPCCGSTLVREGVNMRCINTECGDQIVTQLALFIKKLGVKSASEKTLKNFGITSFSKLLSFKPNPKYKSEMKLVDELNSKMFTRSKKDLFYAMDFMGLSEIMLSKIVDFYGLDKIEEYDHLEFKLNTVSDFQSFYGSAVLPLGIGEITLQKFLDGLHGPLVVVNKIISDSRWHYSEVTLGNTEQKNQTIGSICVTGSLKFGSRNKFLDFAKQNGYESKSGVVKGLTYLINNDINSTSSKNKKAKQLGIRIISEDEFMKIVSNSAIESELFKL